MKRKNIHIFNLNRGAFCFLFSLNYYTNYRDAFTSNELWFEKECHVHKRAVILFCVVVVAFVV